MRPIGWPNKVIRFLRAAFGEQNGMHGFLNAALRGVRLQLVLAAGLALFALLAATALSVCKPPGLTQYGWRKLR
jgi:hypothetical protein